MLLIDLRDKVFYLLQLATIKELSSDLRLSLQRTMEDIKDWKKSEAVEEENYIHLGIFLGGKQ